MTTETAVPTTNSAGRASLVLAIVIVVIGLGQQIVSQSLPLIVQGSNLDVSMVGVIFAVFQGVIGVLAVVGLVLGIVGLGRAYAPRAAAGAGTAIAASALLTAVVAFTMPLLLNALY